MVFKQSKNKKQQLAQGKPVHEYIKVSITIL